MAKLTAVPAHRVISNVSRQMRGQVPRDRANLEHWSVSRTCGMPIRKGERRCEMSTACDLVDQYIQRLLSSRARMENWEMMLEVV